MQSILPILAAYPGAVCTYNTAEVSQQSFGSKLIYNLSLNKKILLLFYMHSLYFLHVCLHALINVCILYRYMSRAQVSQSWPYKLGIIILCDTVWQKGTYSFSDCVILWAHNFKRLKVISLKFTQYTLLCWWSLVCKMHWHRPSRKKATV